MWLVETGVPQVRRVGLGESSVGQDWIGLVANQRYRVDALVQAPLLPVLLMLFLLLGGLLMAWRVEGR